VVETKTTQTASVAQPAVHSRKHDSTVPIAAGGVLALLAIGSAAVAVNRRRNEDEEEWTDVEGENREPVTGDFDGNRDELVEEEQPTIVAPPVSAFQWRTADQSTVAARKEPLAEGDDRADGETWIQRAYRGPSPLNPSVSLKTRLKRAAFFDKRERDAAAGLAEPVEPTAGLPERMVEENHDERQGEFA
jgi:hypothetical protein